MNKILKVLAIFLLIFTVGMIVIFCVKDSIPDTLVTCVFGACTGELSIMGWIKASKVKKGEEDELDSE